MVKNLLSLATTAAAVLFLLDTADANDIVSPPPPPTYIYDSNGANWCADEHANCCLDRQSPIDLPVSGLTVLPDLTPLWISDLTYDRELDGTFENDGQMAKFIPDPSSTPLLISSGPFAHPDTTECCGPSAYRFAEMRFHWGLMFNSGSEHRVNGMRYMGEIQLVHFNIKYGSLEAALDEPDGLAVLAFIVQKVDDPRNDFIRMFNTLAGDIPEPGDQVAASGVNLSGILGEVRLDQYWTYLGSLSTPDCQPTATWIVFRCFIHAKRADFFRFRMMVNSDGGRLYNNYRETLPLNGRDVYSTAT